MRNKVFSTIHILFVVEKVKTLFLQTFNSIPLHHNLTHVCCQRVKTHLHEIQIYLLLNILQNVLILILYIILIYIVSFLSALASLELAMSPSHSLGGTFPTLEDEKDFRQLHKFCQFYKHREHILVVKLFFLFFLLSIMFDPHQNSWRKLKRNIK